MSVNLFGDEWEGGRDRARWRWNDRTSRPACCCSRAAGTATSRSRSIPTAAKVGIFGKGVRKLLREDAEVDYFDGEE